MFTVLVESRKRRRFGWRGATASVLAHAALVVGAVRATVVGMEPPPPHETPIPLTPYLPPNDPVPTSRAGGTSGAAGPHRVERPLPALPHVPPVSIHEGGLPSISMDSLISGAVDFSPAGSSAGEARGDGLPAGSVYESSGVDRLAEPLPGNPPPVYPSALRSAGVEAVLSARFVIDTTGRVERGSIAFDGAPDALFAAAVRHALERSRFTPAEARGRRVRVLARQSFVFRIER
ncbi:MAG TPA: energy transducer TonB [Gemmatimonadaceae bacterium]|nr:energy transducer TonB [Gemmatimonadaceae bacterium]